ncbi:hypothetical protein THASP1DRAFT_31257 [Thamnocephalis sphaerospora]|uniref:Uncharacterized protein n=1 Tax=Thamnocephalis sphaerospora TaxID=78915 RepID=A0A4P9XM22_9FUNG|nr:hypothetical protein THASP1DRAFT_31257 [Thamnocephalis sphaerospora]|eukprot:RKP06934.1 hypothetical protein THASP1DRAFT_31257 [Thamnocephalis sphaerospora]
MTGMETSSSTESGGPDVSVEESAQFRSFVYAPCAKTSGAAPVEAAGAQCFSGEQSDATRDIFAQVTDQIAQLSPDKVQTLADEQAKQMLQEAVQRVRQLETTIAEQRKELIRQHRDADQIVIMRSAEQAEQWRQHYAARDQEASLQHAVELELKSQEVRALIRRVDTLQANMRKSFEGDAPAMEQLKNIEAAAVEGRKLHQKEMRALRRKLRTSEGKVFQLQIQVAQLQEQLYVRQDAGSMSATLYSMPPTFGAPITTETRKKSSLTSSPSAPEPRATSTTRASSSTSAAAGAASAPPSALDNLASVAERLMSSDQVDPDAIEAEMAAQFASDTKPTKPAASGVARLTRAATIPLSYEVGEGGAGKENRWGSRERRRTASNAGDASSHDRDVEAGDDNDDDDDDTGMSTDSEDGLPPPGAIAPGAASRSTFEAAEQSRFTPPSMPQLVGQLSAPMSGPLVGSVVHGAHTPRGSSDMLAFARKSLSRPIIRPAAISGPPPPPPLSFGYAAVVPGAGGAYSAASHSSVALNVLARPRVTHTRWTEAEDELLRRAVMEHGEHGASWDAIASCVPSRGSSQCRHRWFRIRTGSADAAERAHAKLDRSNSLGSGGNRSSRAATARRTFSLDSMGQRRSLGEPAPSSARATAVASERPVAIVEETAETETATSEESITPTHDSLTSDQSSVTQPPPASQHHGPTMKRPKLTEQPPAAKMDLDERGENRSLSSGADARAHHTTD